MAINTPTTFYLDPINGSDTYSSVSISSSTDTTPIQITTSTAHNYVTGECVTVASHTTNTNANGTWKITVIDSTKFTLNDSTATGSGAGSAGTVTTFGGVSWSKPWKTITSGATSTRIKAGDTIKIAKSPAPTLLGTSNWRAPFYSIARDGKSFTYATNASPVVITSNGHGLSNDDIVMVTSAETNYGALGMFKVSNVTTNTFALTGSTGTASASSGSYSVVNNKVITIDESLNAKLITKCEPAFSAQNSATCTYDTSTMKEGNGCAVVTLPSSGLVANRVYAYRSTCTTEHSGGIGNYVTLDLSSYQGITLWFKTSNALADNTRVKVCLCSDTAGATPVDTFIIPAIPSTSTWIPLTLWKQGGGNLGSAIKSVAIYTGTSFPTASTALYFDNICAVKTGGITLNSLISKDPNEVVSTESWFPIRSLNKSFIEVETSKYSDTYGNFDLYIRDTIPTAYTSSQTAVATTTVSGTLGNQITYSGGWNTNTDIQDGETFFDGGNGYGYGIDITKPYIKLDRLSFVRYYYGVQVSGYSNEEMNLSTICGCSNSGVYLSNTYNNIISIKDLNQCSTNFNYNSGGYSNITIGNTIGGSHASNGGGFHISNSSNVKVSIQRCWGHKTLGIASLVSSPRFTYIGNVGYCGDCGLLIYDGGCTIEYLGNVSYNKFSGIRIGQVGTSVSSHNNTIYHVESISTNGNYGIEVCGNNNKLYDIGTISNHGTGIWLGEGEGNLISGKVDANISGNSNTSISFKSGVHTVCNFNLTDTTKINSTVSGATICRDPRLYFHNVDGTHKTILVGGTIETDTNIVHSTGMSWKLTNTGIRRPIYLPLANIAVVVGNITTVSAYVKKSTASQYFEASLCCFGSQAGIGVLSSTKKDDTDWEKLSISFTPTVSGVVEITGMVYVTNNNLNNNSAWFDDLSIS